MSDLTQPKKKAQILVVDDTPANLLLLTELLQKQGYDTRPVPNGETALKVAQYDPPDLILLDINMPGLNGFEVCERLKADENLKGIPVIFISALEDTKDKVTAFHVGGLDYITKPFQFEEVNARVETHLSLRRFQLHLEQMVQDQLVEITASQMSTIFALAKLAESRDDDTGRHVERVQEYCKLLAEKLFKFNVYIDQITSDFIHNLYHATPLHDIGKVGIPDAILLKPGKLTKDEFDIIKTHTIIGGNTLLKAHQKYPNNSFIKMGIEIARHHHERWDGTGYPDKLNNEIIPLPARIMAVADAYDALRSERPYKDAFPHEKCVKIIREGSGTQFDPNIISCFIEVEDEFDETHRVMTSD